MKTLKTLAFLAAIIGIIFACKKDEEEKQYPVSSVELNRSEARIAIDDTIHLSCTVKPIQANQKVSWTSSDKNVAIVSSKGIVTAITEGETTITVTSDDGNKKAYCFVTVSNAVTGVTLNRSSLSLLRDESFTLVPTVSPPNAKDKTVSWKSSNTAVATVDSNGKVTAKALGKADITVTTRDGSFTAVCKVDVVDIKVTSVTLDKSSLILATGSNSTLKHTVLPANATNKEVTWLSSNTTIATVNQSGLVTALKEGSATISVTSADGGHKANCAVTVTPIYATSVSLNRTSYSFDGTGGELTLQATVLPANAANKNVTWSSSNSSVASVTQSGLVKALSDGSATITVTTVDGGHKATCAITVTTTHVSSISLNHTSHTFQGGGELALQATVLPANASNKTITWSSSNTSVASVDANGKVTSLQKGSATITATSVNGKTATCQITILKNVYVIGFSGETYRNSQKIYNSGNGRDIKGAYVKNGNVYTAGSIAVAGTNRVGRYWVNGQERTVTNLGTTGNSSVNSIYVHNNNIYTTGYNDSPTSPGYPTSYIWKDGAHFQTLSLPSLSSAYAVANAIFVDGSGKCYVAGHYLSNGVIQDAVKWEATSSSVSSILLDGVANGTAKHIAVSGGNVYTAGNSRNSGTLYVWQNDWYQPYITIDAASPQGFFVSGSDVYLGTVGGVYKNDTKVFNGSSYGVCVADNNVYHIGENGYVYMNSLFIYEVPAGVGARYIFVE